MRPSFQSCSTMRAAAAASGVPPRRSLPRASAMWCRNSSVALKVCGRGRAGARPRAGPEGRGATHEECVHAGSAPGCAAAAGGAKCAEWHRIQGRWYSVTWQYARPHQHHHRHPTAHLNLVQHHERLGGHALEDLRHGRHRVRQPLNLQTARAGKIRNVIITRAMGRRVSTLGRYSLRRPVATAPSW